MLIPSCTDVACVSTCGSSDVEGLVCTEFVLAVYVSVCVVVREDSVCLPLTGIPAALGILVLGQGNCQISSAGESSVLGYAVIAAVSVLMCLASCIEICCIIICACKCTAGC